MFTLCIFSALFAKKYFDDFLLAFLYTCILQKRDLLKRERICSLVANSFHLGQVPLDKGDKNLFDSNTTLSCVSITLNIFRKRTAFHGSSSSTSSSESSSDEERFQRRKAKSMMKARNR